MIVRLGRQAFLILPLYQPGNGECASCGDGADHHHSKCTTQPVNTGKFAFKISKNKQTDKRNN
jgi:hypothetical protein